MLSGPDGNRYILAARNGIEIKRVPIVKVSNSCSPN